MTNFQFVERMKSLSTAVHEIEVTNRLDTEVLKMEHTFRLAGPSDIDAVFQLYKKRIQWMDEKGIRQWNVTGYLDAYPIDYYRTQQFIGNLYVLEENSTIIGAVVLLQEDDRWREESNVPAFYIHNLVADTEVHGGGKEILLEVERIARRQGKRFIRLDCARDNLFLNALYRSFGYEMSGICREGTYVGNRREKVLV